MYCIKTALQVGKNIVDVLGSDGKANGILPDALICQFFRSELAVRGGRGVNDKALDIGYIGKQRENFQAVNKCMCLRYTALDLKSEDRRAAVREIFLIQRMVGMVGQRRMVDMFDLRMICEKFYNLFGILGMALQAQRQRFDPL